jgi:enamine deaminase RidA (YjgF/YER057c/UK114 family)
MARQIERLALASAAAGRSALGARVGDMVLLAGLNGLPGGGGDGRPGVEEQARGLFANARAALRVLGADLADVVQARFYVTDWRWILPLNAAYAEVFSVPFTARTTVRSPSLGHPAALLEASFAAVGGGQNRALEHPDLFRLPVPLAQAGVLAGDWFFGTGLFGVDQALVPPATIGGQTERALLNQMLALEAAGMTADDVVKVTLFVSDPRHLEGMLAAFQTFFRPPYPALTISVATLARPECLVEVEVLASKAEKVSLLAPGTSQASRPGWRSELVEGLPRADQQESAAVLCGGWLFSGGLVGLDPDGAPLAGLQAQLAGVAAQLRLLLSKAGCATEDLLLLSGGVGDWRYAAAWDESASAGFGEVGRLLVEAPTVRPELLVQLEAVAVAGAGQQATVLLPAQS